jgi:hypothetical protein
MTVTGQGAIPANTTVTAVTATTVTLSAAPTGTAANKSLDFGYITYAASGFNLKTYGLLVYLLNNNVKLKWVIRPGKTKDAVDFTVHASMIKPSSGSASVYDFASGPFVIFQQDTTGVAALVQTYNGAASTDDVKMYRTNAAVSVDVRYDYYINGGVWKPKAAILNDGGNAQVHTNYMVNANVPASNYTVVTTTNLVVNCFTFACEPHNDDATNSVVQSVTDFVNFGGNFLAECASVRTFENSTSGRYQSTSGILSENGGNSTPAYTNSDMAYFQINGFFGVGNVGGSLESWEVFQSTKNNFHYFSSELQNGKTYTNASASKATGTGNYGGMVFYLGGHSYDGSTDNDINGQRLFLNAFLIPTNPQGTLQSSAVMSCGGAGGNLTVHTGSSSGPSQSYPLIFTLYEDRAPAGFGAEDVQKGNTVTMTAPNTYQGGISAITTPSPYATTNYVVAIRPALGCFQTKYLTNSCTAILPVTMLTFTATRNSALVNLKWSTSSEANSLGFNIERLTGNGSWELVGYVASQAKDGNSAERLDYSFVDHNNFKGNTQYRIKHMDLDKNARYSEIRTVRSEDQKGGVLVYPNPSEGRVNISFDNASARRDLSVNDMSGRMVKQMKNITASSVSIDNLLPGIYVVRVLDLETGDMAVEKIVVNKR